MTADVLDLLPQAAPGGWQALYEPHAPGAVLDGEPWAANWATFLRAVNDPRDSSARTKIANAAMGERVGSEGGFLVPEVLRAQVLAYMTPAIVRPRATVLPMSSLRLPVPTLDNPSQASTNQALGGLTFSFTEEGAAIANTTPAFGRVVLEARKLAALCTAPNELADDAGGAWGDFLARVIAMGLAWVEDDYFIGTNGTGVGCPQSLINAPCAVGIDRNTSSDVLFLDVVAMFKALHPASKQVGLAPGVTDVCWLLSSSAMDQLLELNYQVTIADGDGTNTTTTPIPPSGWFSMGDGHDIGPNMLGLPAIVTDHQPAIGSTGDVILADLRHFLIGDRQVMQIERAPLGAQFINDNSLFRVRSRVDGRYWVQSASTTEAGQSVSPVVVLDTHT
jgi:HK97 family phage major capsid protein